MTGWELATVVVIGTEAFFVELLAAEKTFCSRGKDKQQNQHIYVKLFRDDDGFC